MIKYRIGRTTTQVRQWFFPDGCVGVDINIGQMPVDCGQFDIIVTLKFGQDLVVPRAFSINDDIMALAFTVDALKRQYPLATLHLDMPYVPYARQDRVCNPGEAHQLKVVAQQINSLDFATVTAVDPHSTVCEALFDRFYTVDQISIFEHVKHDWSDTYIVAPDQGASKKAEAFAKAVNAAGVITCAKVREMSTGKILGLKVLDYVPDAARLFVLDDLADGSFTFVKLNELLLSYKPDSIELAVTHGLFTKGSSVVTSIYDRVYTTDSFISNKEGCNVLQLD